MAKYQVMRWRGIPVQVKAVDDAGQVVTRPLPGFFQKEIDRVAMAEGLIDSDDYLEGWGWSETHEREGAAEEVAEAVAEETAAAWMREHRPQAARSSMGEVGG